MPMLTPGDEKGTPTCAAAGRAPARGSHKANARRMDDPPGPCDSPRAAGVRLYADQGELACRFSSSVARMPSDSSSGKDSTTRGGLARFAGMLAVALRATP